VQKTADNASFSFILRVCSFPLSTGCTMSVLRLSQPGDCPVPWLTGPLAEMSATRFAIEPFIVHRSSFAIRLAAGESGRSLPGDLRPEQLRKIGLRIEGRLEIKEKLGISNQRWSRESSASRNAAEAR